MEVGWGCSWLFVVLGGVVWFCWVTRLVLVWDVSIV